MFVNWVKDAVRSNVTALSQIPVQKNLLTIPPRGGGQTFSMQTIHNLIKQQQQQQQLSAQTAGTSMQLLKQPLSSVHTTTAIQLMRQQTPVAVSSSSVQQIITSLAQASPAGGVIATQIVSQPSAGNTVRYGFVNECHYAAVKA